MPPSRLPATLKLELQRELDSIRRSVAVLEARLAQVDDAGAASTLTDDALVDQRTVPAPPDLFLRLARRGAFPSKKHGKRIVARWGDVRHAMLEVGPGIHRAGERHGTSVTLRSDGLDGVRQRLGLVSKDE